MIYGLLTGICIAAALSVYANSPITTPLRGVSYETRNLENAVRSSIRLIAGNAFVIALSTLIGLLIRGS